MRDLVGDHPGHRLGVVAQEFQQALGDHDVARASGGVGFAAVVDAQHRHPGCAEAAGGLGHDRLQPRGHAAASPTALPARLRPALDWIRRPVP
ncbi:hypothetical protein HDA32_005609 [Spinactinospora alkalitolerans]|uniref:Uncharacterized protein n=1 Tax=Spinactinospora alkalitolerans TaxID=687207 RepID=A0A852U2Q8_9ACTN|nr:hypothetical protein [Spinactinospora alkalitolerans]